LDGENYKLDRNIQYEDHSKLFDNDIATEEEIAKQCFEANQGNSVDLDGILHSMTDGASDTRFVSPPSEFSIKTFLESLKNDSNTDEMSELIKGAANYALENLTFFELLTKVLWCRVAQLFEDYVSENAVVIIPSQILRETTKKPETLNVTESRQFREHRLLNISDGAYEFFMLLEQQRVDQINSVRLSQQGPDLIEDSIEDVTKNEVLQTKFLNLFCLDDNGDKVSLGILWYLYIYVNNSKV
jgi:hypothetical protein